MYTGMPLVYMYNLYMYVYIYIYIYIYTHTFMYTLIHVAYMCITHTFMYTCIPLVYVYIGGSAAPRSGTACCRWRGSRRPRITILLLLSLRRCFVVELRRITLVLNYNYDMSLHCVVNMGIRVPAESYHAARKKRGYHILIVV